jgi:hypothetical protein
MATVDAPLTPNKPCNFSSFDCRNDVLCFPATVESPEALALAIRADSATLFSGADLPARKPAPRR